MKIRAEGFWDSFWCLLKNDPPSHIRWHGVPEYNDFETPSKLLAQFLAEADSRPIFVLGPWGSGKTTFIRSYIQTLNSGYRIRLCSFFSIGDLDSGYLHLLGFWNKAALFGLFALVAVVVPWARSFELLSDYRDILIARPLIGLPWFGSILLLSSAYLFFKNAFRSYYIAGSILSWLIPCKKQLIVLEDLERSSMKSEDIWALCSNLWNARTKYVVVLGYSAHSKRAELIEGVTKLEGKLIELPTSSSINHRIICKLEPTFPFNDGKWLAQFTPRGLIELQQVVSTHQLSKPGVDRRLIFIVLALRELMNRLGLDDNDRARATISMKQGLPEFAINWHSGMNTIRINEFSPIWGPVFLSFCNSVSTDIRTAFLAAARHDFNFTKALVVGDLEAQLNLSEYLNAAN